MVDLGRFHHQVRVFCVEILPALSFLGISELPEKLSDLASDAGIPRLMWLSDDSCALEGHGLIFF